MNTRNASRRSVWATMEAAAGAAFTITPVSASQSTASSLSRAAFSSSAPLYSCTDQGTCAAPRFPTPRRPRSDLSVTSRTPLPPSDAA